MVITPGRPTQRLLKSLHEGWQSAADKKQVDAELRDVSKPLPELQHPIIAKARSDFDEDSSLDRTLKREGITDLKDPMWWKVKTGRWRGAVYQDDDGQAWLCAAGLRRGKEAGDFYQAFMSDVNAHGPESFLPTKGDRDRLSDELAQTEFLAWEKELQEAARDCVMQARQDGQSARSILGPSGMPLVEVTVACTREELDGDVLADLHFEFVCQDWNQVEFLEWAETVMCLAIDPHEQTWRPTGIADGRAYSMLLDEADSSVFFRRLEEPPSEPGVSIAGDQAHWTHRQRLTQSTIMGEAVKGLCGCWFVPRQDHAEKPPCRMCEAVYGQLGTD